MATFTWNPGEENFFKKISGLELDNIQLDDLCKLQEEISSAIERREKENYNNHFKAVIEAIDNLIQENQDCECLGEEFWWGDLKKQLLEYHKYGS